MTKGKTMEILFGLVALVWWGYLTIWLVNVHSVIGEIEQTLRQQKALQQDMLALLEKLQKDQ
jgi:hypothetical protein